MIEAIGKIGTNVNQVAKYCNTKKEADRMDRERMIDLLAALERSINKVANILMEEKRSGDH